MYKLVVVDDEKAICKGICTYIDWESMGFQVVKDFEDGKETIEYIKEYDVDVILTDIEMAEVSGLALSEFVKQHMPDIKVVIISGYKEFEYARKAVEFGVEHYLLKPVKMEEVNQVFTKIKKDLDERKAYEIQSDTAKKDLEALFPELREQFWTSLLVGGFRSEEVIRRRIDMLQMGVDIDHPCGILRVHLKDRDETYSQYYEGENYHNLVYNIFGSIGEEIHSFPVFLSEEAIKIVVVSGKKESLLEFQDHLNKKIQEICLSTLELLKFEFEIKIERLFDRVVEMAKHDYLSHSSERVYHQDVEHMLPSDYQHLVQKYKLLMGIINDGDFEQVDGLLDTIFFEFRNLRLEQMKQLSIDIFSMLSNKFLKMGVDFWRDVNQKVSYQKIMDTTNRRELKGCCKDMMRDAVAVVKSRQNISSRNFVEQSVAYIKEHYTEDLSLERIADRFFLNQAYFSRLFKQYTGNTFTDYLIELRMEKAKELLALGKYKVYEVSKMVGYQSEKYFFRIFKQYTGCSPAEYYRGRSINENYQQ